MKMNFEIEIDASVDDVWAAFDSPHNMTRWMQNLVSYEQLSGEPGQPGAQGKLTFDENGKEVILIETVTERREPDFLAGKYEADHGTTHIVNHFEALDGNRTRYTSWVRCEFKGFLRFIAIFIRGAMRKRTEADMHRLKLMIESDAAQVD